MPVGRFTTDPRTVLVSVRLAPRHKRMLEARARREGISLSESLRRFLDEASRLRASSSGVDRPG
jgi:hypothetical protein